MNVDNMLDRAAGWLLKQQDQNSGGWPPYHGGPISTLNTAEVIVALLDMNQEEYANNPQIKKGLDFIERERCCDGNNRGAWLRSVPRTDEKIVPIPDIIRTSFAVQALIRAYRGNNSAAQEGLDWLIKVRRDNGWGYSEDAPISIMPTCFALLALNDATSNRIRRYTDIIESGIRCLIDFRQDCGSFCSSQDRIDRLEAIHTVYVILTLQAVRISRVSNAYYEEEERGLRWLLDHPEYSLQIIEDRIAIDGQDGAGSYDFLYLASTFVPQVMLNARQEEFRNIGRNILLEEALKGLMSTWNSETGGFYSPRPVTWATAKAITSLKSSIDIINGFEPVSHSIKDPVKVGRDILIFLIFMVLVVAALTFYGVFTSLSASIFIIFAIIALAGYDVISDKTLITSLKLFFTNGK